MSGDMIPIIHYLSAAFCRVEFTVSSKSVATLNYEAIAHLGLYTLYTSKCTDGVYKMMTQLWE